MWYGPLSYHERGRAYPRYRLREPFQPPRRRMPFALYPPPVPVLVEVRCIFMELLPDAVRADLLSDAVQAEVMADAVQACLEC